MLVGPSVNPRALRRIFSVSMWKVATQPVRGKAGGVVRELLAAPATAGNACARVAGAAIRAVGGGDGCGGPRPVAVEVARGPVWWSSRCGAWLAGCGPAWVEFGVQWTRLVDAHF